MRNGPQILTYPSRLPVQASAEKCEKSYPFPLLRGGDMPLTPRVFVSPPSLTRLSLCLAGLVTAVHSAPLYWDGNSSGPDADGGPGSWSTGATNWDSSATGGSDVPWTDGSEAVFGGAGGAVTVSGSTITASGLTFSAPGYQLGGGTIQVSSPFMVDTGSHDVAVNSVIAGSGTFTKKGSGILTLGGLNTYSGITTISEGILKVASSTALGSMGSRVEVANGATLDANGRGFGTKTITISGSGVGGAGALVNTGSATTATSSLILDGDSTIGGTGRWDIGTLAGGSRLQLEGRTLTKTGSNDVYFVGTTVTHPGTIDIRQGRLWLESNTSFSTTTGGTIKIRNGGTLAHSQHDRELQWSLAFDEGSTWHSGYVASSWRGPVTLDGAVTFDVGPPQFGSSSTMRVLGVISGPGSMTKTGPGAWTLSALNTFTGGTTVNEGTLVLNRWGTGTTAGLGALQGPVTVNGGTLTLAGPNVVGTRPGQRVSELTIHGGLVALTAGGENGVPLLKIGSGTLRSGSGGPTPTSSAYYVLANEGMIRGLAAAAPGTIGGRLHLGTGNTGKTSVIDIDPNPAGAGLRIDAAITEESTGSGITKRGEGLLTLNGPSLYTGSTMVEEGTLLLGVRATLTNSPVLVKNGGSFATNIAGKSILALTADAGSSLQMPAIADVTTTVGGELAFGGGNITIHPLLGADTAAGTYDLITAAHISGPGVPVLDLGAAYGPTRATGTVAVNGNKVQLTITGTGGDLLWKNASAGENAAGVWDATLANFHDGVSNSTFHAFDSVTFNDAVALGSPKEITMAIPLAPARLTVDNSAGDYIFHSSPGALAGAGSLVKTGSGKLVVNGPNGYTMAGPISASGGSINFSGQRIASSKLTLSGGASFDNATASFASMELQSGTVTALLTGDGSWAKTTPGTVNLTADNTLSGAGTIQQGSLIVGNVANPDGSGSLGPASVNIASGASLGFVRGVSSPSVSIKLSGSGALNLSSINDGSNGIGNYTITQDNGTFSGPVTATNARILFGPGGNVGNGPITLTDFSSLELISTTAANPIFITNSSGPWGSSSVFGNGHLKLNNSVLEGPISLAGGGTYRLLSDFSGNPNLPGSRSSIKGVISETGGSANVTIGRGTSANNELILTGANTYTGTTSIDSQTILDLKGSLGPSAVTVAALGILGGNGVIGSGGSLSFQNMAVLKADMSSEALTVNGNVDLGPATSLRVDVAVAPVSGPFPVLKYTGALTGGPANLLVGSSSFRQAVFNFSPGLITLDIGRKALVWQSGTTWDSGTSVSWRATPGGAANERFFNGDSVVFDDTGSGGYISGPGGSFHAQPSSMLVNNSTKEYFIGTNISGPCSVTKDGSGTLRLSGFGSAYTGGTFINSGRLEAAGTGSSGTALGYGPVNVAAGATLAGDAYIQGPVTVLGVIDPLATGGQVSGTLSTGSLTLSGTYVCDLDGTSSTARYDRLAVSGDLDLTGSALVLNFSTGLFGYNPLTITIASYTGNLVGTFSSVTGMPSGYKLAYLSDEKRIVLERITYEEWASGFPSLGDTSTTGDPDGDGIPNLLEFVLSGNPTLSEEGILPKVSVNSDYLLFNYKRDDAAFHYTVQTVQWSTDTVTWNDIAIGKDGSGPVWIPSSNGSGPDDVVIMIPRVDGHPMFARLKVARK